MEYRSAKETAQRWNVTPRRVQQYCREGLVPGATRAGTVWLIPQDAPRPGRERTQAPPVHTVLPRRAVNLVLSDLYRTPGTADRVAQTLSGEGAALFAAQLAYYRGEISQAKHGLHDLLQTSGDLFVRAGAGIMLAQCAVYLGDAGLWREGREAVAAIRLERQEASQDERACWDLCVAAADGVLLDDSAFPDWFRRGSFGAIPADCYPALRVSFALYCYSACYRLLFERPAEATPENPLFLQFPLACELLLSQSRGEGVVVSELILELMCAVAYHGLGRDDLAIPHIDRAVTLALPDRLYAPLAENLGSLDFLLEERLALADKGALLRVRELNKAQAAGWLQLHNAQLGREARWDRLTRREREVTRLAAQGRSNRDISDLLHISLNTVKQTLRLAMDKLGVSSRRDLGTYL